MTSTTQPPIDKRELRRWASQRRASLDAVWRGEAAAAARKNGIKLIKSRDAKTVALFTSFGDEIDTHQFILELLEENIRVALPRVVHGEKRIELLLVDRFPEGFRSGRYGILEPDPALFTQVLAPADFDIIFVPGLLFTRSGWRLGYGGGFYDQLLNEEHSAPAVGYCFSSQIVENLPHESWDQPVDMVVTE